ncbi:kinase-like protein [Rhizophagus irregularis]|uniref:Kinase-like protein n=1 Tax=Rhizophagus irregularis TaxID=588596 RepID=A0A2N0NSD7_9GLOM|nr:kinase-like protein [Rhizophagus irregularis]
MALNNDKVSGNIEFEGSNNKEFEGSGSEEFKGSDSEEFEKSSIKESKDGKNVEYLDKGGFGTIYKAIWFYDYKDNEVILKCYNNLSENLNEFLNEWKYHGSCLDSYDIIYFYGFTKNPDTLKYMAVMDYANNGNLRGNLTRIIKSNWNEKLYLLYEIISGLNDIHDQGLIHCDFHDGNILNHNESKIYISDLGLCKPVKSFLKKYDIYGVIPFMAPEVLRGEPYTPASDIYSFSMIMWEFTSGVPPFNNRAHDIQLSLSICKGERPEIIKNTPQCYVDLMKKCWDENPLKRPSSNEVLSIITNWIFYSSDKKIKDINEELKSNIMEFINAPIGHNNNLATESHPQACYTSRLLGFTSKQLNEILESEDSQGLDDCIVTS